jgi:hypothetical protein
MGSLERMFDEQLARRRAEKERRAETGGAARDGGPVEGGTPNAPVAGPNPSPARRSGIDASLPVGDRDDKDDEEEWL